MNTDLARQKMIDQQVRAWDVFDPDVLEVLAEMPREQFVPREYESLAFADTEIPIGHGESMMTPTIEGRVLQALELTGSERVLEVGTGTGFLAACFAKLAAEVMSLDIHDDFLKRAAENLADASIDNVELAAMDATAELPEGSFDAIMLSGSIQVFNPRYLDALGDGGRLFIVVGESPVMDARIIRRATSGDFESQSLFETDLKALTNGALPPQFYF